MLGAAATVGPVVSMMAVVGDTAFAVVLPSDVATVRAGNGEVAGFAAMELPATSVTPPFRPLTATDVRALVPAYCSFAEDGVCAVTVYWQVSASFALEASAQVARCPAVTTPEATDVVMSALANKRDAETVYVPTPPGIPEVWAEIVVGAVRSVAFKVWPTRRTPDFTSETVRTVPAVEVLMPLSMRPVTFVGPVLRA